MLIALTGQTWAQTVHPTHISRSIRTFFSPRTGERAGQPHLRQLRQPMQLSPTFIFWVKAAENSCLSCCENRLRTQGQRVMMTEGPSTEKAQSSAPRTALRSFGSMTRTFSMPMVRTICSTEMAEAGSPLILRPLPGFS